MCEKLVLLRFVVGNTSKLDAESPMYCKGPSHNEHIVCPSFGFDIGTVPQPLHTYSTDPSDRFIRDSCKNVLIP